MRLKQHIPFLQWLKEYQLSWLKNDLFAGITIGVILIPQGISYAIIAGLPPIYGLYTALIPQVVYAFLGTSRQLAIGPAAMDSLIVASGIATLATIGSEHFIVLAILLAFMVGFFQVIFGIFRMGFLVNFLSKPVISGFTSGSAIIIGMNQIGNLLGVEINRSNQLQELIKAVFNEFNNMHLYSALIGIISILLVVGIKKLNNRIPAALIAVILSILVVYMFDLDGKGVVILGEIPAGLPQFIIPVFDTDLMQEISGLALTLALIGFMEAISIAKSIESKHNSYRVDANKELIALGFGNMVGSLFQTYPATAGFARSAVNDQSGAKTPLSSLFAAMVIALSLLFLTPAFFYLPKAVLAGIIIVAAYGLLDFSMPKKILTYNIRDLIILNSTLMVTIFVGIKEGIMFGIILSLVMLIYKTTKPHIAVLGNVPGTHFYRNVRRFKDVIVHKEILIIRFDAQLYFANTQYFKDKLKEFSSEKGNDLRLLVIDGESLNALDSSAIYALEEIHDYFTAKGITIVFSGLKGPVRDTLVKSKLMKKIRYDHCFMSIQEAVDCYKENCFELPKRYSYQEYTKQSNR
ncbi:solute carrier family 26 protein [Lutimonas saemankumensis]|uniref:SulP family inorganic anion transporter n=1 Tax=Lutimonas saemankumensis TaxID=483016 RepID=UPI001CD535B4|nr:solute carrier family 26 protein [Lutimonas saemankumensis]MCA0932840.1 solute carrier family 26 protein [Lutimonas saemankumensis]